MTFQFHVKRVNSIWIELYVHLNVQFNLKAIKSFKSLCECKSVVKSLAGKSNQINVQRLIKSGVFNSFKRRKIELQPAALIMSCKQSSK